MDTKLLATRLEEFFGSLLPHLSQPDLDQHLRFPTIDSGVFRGSDLGRAIWDGESGKSLVDCLLADETLASFHRREPEFWLTELHGRVASLMTQAAATSDPVEYLHKMTLTLVRELVENPATSTYHFIRGVIVPPGGIILGDWLWLSPSTSEALTALGGHLPRGGLVTAPHDAQAFLTMQVSVDREEWGVTAAATSTSWPEVISLQLLRAIWLASGVLPRVAFRGHLSLGELPDIRDSVDFAAPSERAGGLPPEAPVELDGEHLAGAFSRTYSSPWTNVVHGFDEDTASALRSADLLLQPAMTLADGAVVALACYAAIDGLLRRHEEHETVVIPRIAHLIGASDESRRRLKRAIEALYHIRSAVAHGERPSWPLVMRFLGDDDEPADWFAENETRDRLKWSVLRLARSVWGSLLWLTVGVGDGGVYPNWTRAEVLRRLSDARGGDTESQRALDEAIPSWLRDPDIG